MQPPKPISLSPTLEQNFKLLSSDKWNEIKAWKSLEHDLSSEQLKQIKFLLVVARKQEVNKEKMESRDIMSFWKTGYNIHHNLLLSPDNIHSKPVHKELSLSPI